ncbi:Pol polyprotein [Elysia marginata]|uniref:Pol polyprotein n=1 Tax=Elysia marginata TaxID=1093978 RepID=A0AAV4HLB2_9GAST|nr:Pol polyprotein [Elysia marginata]
MCYFDDILSHSKTKEDHEKLLTLVHSRLEEAGIQLNKVKCAHRKSEITFLKQSKRCPISEPKDTAELRRYLGMVNYLCRYLPPGITKSENVLNEQRGGQESQNIPNAWLQSKVSPHYPQANGAAEGAVQTATTILQQKDQHLALLTYRATPIPSLGKSPAEQAIGRRLRTRLPVIPTVLKPIGVDHEDLQSRNTAAKVSQKRLFDKRTHPLTSLHKSDPVLIKIDGKKGWIIIRDNP